MKKNYEKPLVTVVSFQPNEDLTIETKPSTEVPPPGFFDDYSASDKSSFQFLR